MYQPYAHDATATKQIEQSSGVQNAGRFNKRLLRGCRELEAANSAYSQLYQYFKDNTVPWLDDGVRMLPNALYFEFAEAIRDHRERCDEVVRELVNNWPRLVSEDLQRLGPLGNSQDYPAAWELRDRFQIKIAFMPIPTTDDFRIDIDDEDKKRLEESINEAQENVRKHLLTEMLNPVRRMVEKLSIPIGSTGAIFRDSLAENIFEEVKRLQRLNINDDPDIKYMLREVESTALKLTGNLDVLRESPTMRDNAREEMEKVMKKMSGMFGLVAA
jgi:hypothetical protein